MKYTKRTETEADIPPSSDLLIIGGGAAGMFAAARLAESGLKITVLEPMRTSLKKLRISGKGRCNLTNNCSIEQVQKNVMRNPKFLYSALSRFSPADTMEWFGSHGVSLKTERGGRVFPISDRAEDIAKALEAAVKAGGAKIVGDRAVEIVVFDGKVVGVKGEKGYYRSERVLLATGGASYPATGSTGDGYSLARALGHTVINPRGSLVPINISERFSDGVNGFTLKNVTLSLYGSGRKPIYKELGEMNFISGGIAGALSLTASAYLDEKLIKSGCRISLDLKPALTHEQLIKRIRRDFDETPSLAFGDSLSRLLPRCLISDTVRMSGIDPKKPCNQVTAEETECLAKLLKGLTLTPTSLHPIAEAIVTCGGVKASEIFPATMESKLISGLYFAGEIIDCDALTGGYNLQIAFSTANAAAEAILDSFGD